MPLLPRILQFLSNSDGSGFYFKAIKVDLNLLFLLPKCNALTGKHKGFTMKQLFFSFCFKRGNQGNSQNPQVQDKCLTRFKHYGWNFKILVKINKQTLKFNYLDINTVVAHLRAALC